MEDPAKDLSLIHIWKARIGDEKKIHTFLYVREDILQLYGFFSKDDLGMFKLLIGVNGVGPKGALGILSGISADELHRYLLRYLLQKKSNLKEMCIRDSSGIV